MNHNFQIKNYLAENGRRVNELLRWVPLVFLILCPVLLVMKQAGVINYKFSSIVEACVVIIIICIFPLFFSKYAYNEDWNRCICLTAIEFFVAGLAVTEIINIHLLYALVPMLSVLYVNKQIFVHCAGNCFFVLLGAEMIKVFFHLRLWATKGISYHVDYLGFVILVLEYVIIMLLLYYLVHHVERMVASGYLMENQGIVLTRDKMLETIWGYDFDGEDRTIDTHIKNLRSSLGEYRDYIVTLRGVGYKFEVKEK